MKRVALGLRVTQDKRDAYKKACYNKGTSMSRPLINTVENVIAEDAARKEPHWKRTR